MSFRSVFIAVLIATGLVVGGLILHAMRPQWELRQPGPEFVRATGKCAECHMRETPAIVHEFERSVHAAGGVTCLDCHQAANAAQERYEHDGFVIARRLTAANCRQCHEQQYQQYLRSRHAAPAWAAVHGPKDFTAEEVAFAEQFHKGWVNRPANALAQLEGQSAMAKGCSQCHVIGRPNPDGTLGTCTACHARHVASVELARLPETCGQCHMGPDHSQLEIYKESKHGVIFNAQRPRMNLTAKPKSLTASDMPVPTCATCHMSGLEGEAMTHDTTQRLSWFLFASVSEKRPTYQQGQINMQEICLKCHTTEYVKTFYAQAEQVLGDTNKLVGEADRLMKALYTEGLLTPQPYDEPIEFVYFDLWHYYGRTAKHGAFMSGADFVQWHGFYEIVQKLTELRHEAEILRREGKPHAAAPAVAPTPTPAP